MSSSNLIFIGPMDLGNTPKTGDTMKNQLFLDRFQEVYEKVYTIDTMYWRKSPWILFSLFWVLLIHRKAKVIISANPGSADKFIRILNALPVKNDIFYWVVGGSFHKMIEDGRFKASTYKALKGIFVQGKTMVESLKKQGLENAQYVANSKIISHYGNRTKKKDDKIHFVFLSRIEEYKGCSDIMASIEQLIMKGYNNKFDVSLRTSSHYFEWIGTGENRKLKLWHRLHDEIGSHFKEEKTNKQNWSQEIKKLYSIVYHKGYSEEDQEGTKDIQALLDHLQNFYENDQMNERLLENIEGYILYLK